VTAAGSARRRATAAAHGADDHARIAIVKLSSLGDVIHALPVARALRAARPEARLTWVVEAREAVILRDHPDLDAVVAVDTRRWRRLLRRPRSVPTALTEIARAARALRRERFDVTVDLQGLLKSGLLTAATRAPTRIGLASSHCRERLNVLFTNRRVAPPDGHVVEQYLALLRPLGIEPAPPVFHVPLRPAAERRMEEFLGEHGVKRTDTLVALNPGAGRADKRWPIAHFVALAERLAVECEARLLVLWGPEEAHLARAIRDGVSARALLAPPTDLDELAALLRRVSLLVAGDTGPLHLAAAVGARCLGLFGPTRARRNGPYGARSQGLQSPDATMAGLGPDAAFAAARALLERP
jgi:lipopolysaccharide heptosyltransferase I